MKMYFVEKRGDTSMFRPVVVNSSARYRTGPTVSFDQSQKEAEATLKAADKKAAQLRNEESG